MSLFPVTRLISFCLSFRNTEPKFMVVGNSKWVVPSFIGASGHSCPFTCKKGWKLSKMPWVKYSNNEHNNIHEKITRF